MGGVCSFVDGCGHSIQLYECQLEKMALTVGDWVLEADSLLEKKSVNEAVDLLNRIGKPSIFMQK